MLKTIKRAIIKHKLKKRHQLKRRIQSKHGINISDGWQSINGLEAREFNPLLYYLLSKQDKMNPYTAIEEYNFKSLAKNYPMIRELIEDELFKDVLIEENSKNISREDAADNLKNLKSILYSITKAQQEFDKLK